MDVAIAGAAEFGRVGRRLIQRIWDPEPVNRATPNEPVWCLGCRYVLETKTTATTGTATKPANNDDDDCNDNNNSGSNRLSGTSVQAERTPGYPTPPADTGKHPAESAGSHAPATPPDSVASSFDSSLAVSEESLPDGGWPAAFLDDFDSRIWMTYRSQFPPIARSPDPRAVYALSFTMRLKTSFSDQAGFSSDTGWGCMIRSGQSLLANAMAITRLGRGKRFPDRPLFPPLPQTPKSLRVNTFAEA
jgi:cysteine protease ATG4